MATDPTDQVRELAPEGIDPATGKPAISGPSPEGTVVETQRLGWRDLPGLLKDTYDEWDRDNATTLAAALAYYLAFALAPTLVLIIAVLGFVVGNGAVKHAVLLRVTDLMGPQGAAFVAQLIESAQRPGNSIPATIVSVVTILVSATGIVAEIQRSMDLIWNVPPRPSLGVWGALKTRAQGLWLVLGGGLLLLGTMVASTILGAFEHRFAGLPGLRVLAHVSELTLSFSFLTALFMLIYKLIPRVLIAWKDAFAGAMMTAFLFSVGKTLLAFYFAHSATASSYGAAGSFAVFLAWVYYSAQIFFFGAELAQVYGERLGRKLVPRPHPPAKAPPSGGLPGLEGRRGGLDGRREGLLGLDGDVGLGAPVGAGFLPDLDAIAEDRLQAQRVAADPGGLLDDALARAGVESVDDGVGLDAAGGALERHVAVGVDGRDQGRLGRRQGQGGAGAPGHEEAKRGERHQHPGPESRPHRGEGS
jgi:membrane protein